MTNDDERRQTTNHSTIKYNKIVVRMPALEAWAISPNHHSTISHTAFHIFNTTHLMSRTSYPVPHDSCLKHHIPYSMSQTYPSQTVL